MSREQNLRDSNVKHATTEKNESQTILEALKQFCATTSIRGLPRVVRSRSLYGKLFWMLGFITATCFLGWRIEELADMYWKHETIVLTSFKVDNEIIKSFPDITICNFHVSSLEINSTILEQMEDEFYSKIWELGKSFIGKNITLEEFMDLLDDNNIQSDVNDSELNDYNNLLNDDDDDDDDDYQLNDALEDFKIHVHDPATFFSFLTSKERLDISHKKKDMITDCRKLHRFAKKNVYLDMECGENLFTKYSDSDNMNCHTIQLQNMPNVTMETKGISMIVNLNHYYEDVYVSKKIPVSTPSERGLKVHIHEHNTMAYAQNHIKVTPGHLIDIEIEVSHHSKLGDPYGRCTEASTVEFRTPNGTEYAYSEGSCIAACIQWKILEKCHCILQEFPLLEDQPVCMSVRNNLSTYVNQLSCLDKFLESSTSHNRICNQQCGPKCKGYSYTSTVSQTRWPNEDQHLWFYNKYISGSIFQDYYEDYAKLVQKYKNAESAEEEDEDFMITDTIDQLRKMTLLRDNFVKLDISITNRQTIYKEVELVSTFTFFNTIASMFIFWIGCTFFSCMEIIEAVAVWIRGRVKSANKHPITKVIPLNKRETMT